MSAAKKIVEIKNKLEEMGHNVHTPPNTEKYVNGSMKKENSSESTKHKIEKDLIRMYFKWISERDVVLVVNEDKNEIKNYVGGNAFLEMGFAHILNKPIYLLNPIPDVSYADEIRAMQPIVINGDLALIK
jgi:nucleoside 2-deoxyribosyltransferase